MPVRYDVTPIYMMLDEISTKEFSVEDYNLAMSKYEVHSLAVTQLEFKESAEKKAAALAKEAELERQRHELAAKELAAKKALVAGSQKSIR